MNIKGLIVLICLLFVTSGLFAAEKYTPPVIQPEGPVRYDNLPWQMMPWGKQHQLHWTSGNIFSIRTDKPLPFDHEVNVDFLIFATVNHWNWIVGKASNHEAPAEIILVDSSTEGGRWAKAFGSCSSWTKLIGIIDDPKTGSGHLEERTFSKIYINVELNLNHEDAMVTLFHEFLHHYFNAAGLPSEKHHAAMCEKVDMVDVVSSTGFRAQVCDPNLGF